MFEILCNKVENMLIFFEHDKEKLFWGVQTMASYSGSYYNSSTRFNRNRMIKANLFINGKEADDYPVTMSQTHVCQPYVKFLDNINQNLNGFLSQVTKMSYYADCNFLLSANIGEETGSLSFMLEFEDEVSDDLVLITCCLFDKTMKIDHNRNFKIY